MIELTTKLDGYKTYVLGIAAIVLICVTHMSGDFSWIELVRDGSIPAMIMALRHGVPKK